MMLPFVGESALAGRLKNVVFPALTQFREEHLG
jgi:hypothetical protein